MSSEEKQTPAQSVSYISEDREPRDPNAPTCKVCGALTTRDGERYKCLSCGTVAPAAQQSAPIPDDLKELWDDTHSCPENSRFGVDLVWQLIERIASQAQSLQAAQERVAELEQGNRSPLSDDEELGIYKMFRKWRASQKRPRVTEAWRAGFESGRQLAGSREMEQP